jgi:hypothetical protein
VGEGDISSGSWDETNEEPFDTLAARRRLQEIALADLELRKFFLRRARGGDMVAVRILKSLWAVRLVSPEEYLLEKACLQPSKAEHRANGITP